MHAKDYLSNKCLFEYFGQCKLRMRECMCILNGFCSLFISKSGRNLSSHTYLGL